MLLAAVLLQAATFSGTISTETPGYELSSLFYLTCVRNVAIRSDVTYEMKFPSYRFTKAPADEMSKVIFRSDVTQAWSATSKHAGQGVLWIAPAKRTCGLDIKAASTREVETTFTELLSFYYRKDGFVVTEQPVKTAIEKDGTVSRLRSWLIQIGKHRVALQGSFADAPISGYQHKLTFTLLN